MSKKVMVFGAGAWGTALANAISNINNVSLWLRNSQQLLAMQNTYINHKYLPDIALNKKLKFTDNLKCAIDSDILVIATPSHVFPQIIQDLKPYIYNQSIVWICKGFINFNSGVYLAHEVIDFLLPNYTNTGVLTGPSFAKEVAIGLPCALTAASHSLDWQSTIQSAFHNKNLRIYTSNDIIGCELGGALKNILAIATGITNGLELGLNAQAALLTRGISEMIRLSSALGANPQTLMGLSGVGDLILTANGILSRNRTVGILLGQGKKLENILSELGHVAEGVNSAKLAYKIARTHNIDTPLIDAVNNVLFNHYTPQQVVDSLLSRQAKSEN